MKNLTRAFFIIRRGGKIINNCGICHGNIEKKRVTAERFPIYKSDFFLAGGSYVCIANMEGRR